LIRTNLTIDDPADAPLDGERRASRDAPAEPATATEAPALSAEHRWLEGLYRRYHHPRFIDPDPLAVVRRCGDPADREVIGLLAASLAYGNVKAILGGLADALDRLAADPDPASADAGSGSGAGAARALLDATPATLRRRFADYRYRVSSGAQVAGLLIGARTLIRRHGSLARSFAAAAGPALDARPAGGAPAAKGDAANPGDNVHRGAADEAAAVCAAVGRWVESLHAAAGASLPGGSRPLVVGAKTFTEQYVLAHVLQARIEERTGRRVRQVPSLGSTVAFDALRAGEIDAYVDYSGTLWATVLGREELPEERSRVLEEVRSFLRRESGVEVVASLGFENTYALAMRGDHAQRLGVETVSGLVSAAPRLSIGADYEFFARPEWRVMREAYGLRFAERRSMDSALMYQAVRTGAVDVITAFSTDGRIAAYDLRVLREDRGVIPPYDAVVLVRPGLAREAPEAVAALRSLDGVLDAETMRRLNRAVDARGRSPERVARDFLAGRIP